MICRICQNEFAPHKYRPHQQVCFNPECQRKRQLQNLKSWRLKNPDYFKYLGEDSAWRRQRYARNKLWKETHKDYLKEYYQKHKEQKKEYMREYMRRCRQKTVS